MIIATRSEEKSLEVFTVIRLMMPMCMIIG